MSTHSAARTNGNGRHHAGTDKDQRQIVFTNNVRFTLPSFVWQCLLCCCCLQDTSAKAYNSVHDRRASAPDTDDLELHLSEPSKSQSKFTIAEDEDFDADEHTALDAQIMKQLVDRKDDEEPEKVKEALRLVRNVVDALQSQDFSNSFNGALTESGVKILFEPIGVSGLVLLLSQLARSEQIKTAEFGINSISSTPQLSESLASLVSENTSLQQLLIWGNGLDDNSVIPLATSLRRNARSSIRTLNLNNNEIGNKGAAAIADLLRSPDCQLENLDLSGNNRISDEGASAIADGLAENKSLSYLSLSSNSISSTGAIQLAQVFSTLRNASLHNLDLSSNLISDEGIIALSLAVSKNKNLTQVNLDGNMIGDNGRQAVIHTLKDNKTSTIILDLPKQHFDLEL